MRTNEWFEHVYDNLLSDNGILIYHDIDLFDDAWPNLRQILYTSMRRRLTHFLFNKNSRPDERCQRGVLVVFKNRLSTMKVIRKNLGHLRRKLFH